MLFNQKRKTIMTATELKLKTSITEKLSQLPENLLRELDELVRKMAMREYIKRHGAKDLPLSPELQWLHSSGSVNISDEQFDEVRYEYLKEKYK